MVSNKQERGNFLVTNRYITHSTRQTLQTIQAETPFNSFVLVFVSRWSIYTEGRSSRTPFDVVSIFYFISFAQRAPKLGLDGPENSAYPMFLLEN